MNELNGHTQATISGQYSYDTKPMLYINPPKLVIFVGNNEANKKH